MGQLVIAQSVASRDSFEVDKRQTDVDFLVLPRMRYAFHKVKITIREHCDIAVFVAEACSVLVEGCFGIFVGVVK